ncbi:MAG TPA: hypothetical protein VKN99_11670 [Polyangia bacterium]|nr:hypothetical protein [Polyangia bacterium]
MISTILLGVLLNLLCGLVLAHSARALIRAHQGKFVQCAALHVGLAFEALVMWPTALYFYFAHPDWTWMYWLDPRRIPRGVVVLVLIVDAAALAAGLLLGYSLIRAGKFRELLLAICGNGAIVLTVLTLLRRRFFHYGTFDDWQAGATLLPLVEVKLGWVLAISVLTVGGALGYASWQLHLAGRRIS